MITGTPKISGLAVLDLTAEIRATGCTLSCKAAWVDTTRGSTHGWTKGEGAIWSKETVERLLELAAAMEMDLAALHFNEARRPDAATERPLAELGGLAEHLDEANQA